MDKKTLDAIVTDIIAAVATQNGLEEAEARTLVGIALKKNRTAFVQAVVVPTLGLVGGPVAAPTAG